MTYRHSSSSALFFALILFVPGCSETSSTAQEARFEDPDSGSHEMRKQTEEEPTVPDAGIGYADASVAYDDEYPGEGEGESGDGDGQIQAGTLTAGAWDDNLNFNHFESYYDDKVEHALDITLNEHKQANERFATREVNTRLDIALVIDTTGSMSDEMEYLKVELDQIAQTIASRHPDADTRWSLIVYRDKGDEYTVRKHDFMDLATTRSLLSAEQAGGGGDFPEASHEALGALDELQWRTDDNVARMVFWLADAPHHVEVGQQMTQAVRDAAKLDVHIYPVASSGIDESTEMSMRQTAQFTGGRYLFLTSDSGIGGEHNEATDACYFVTRLDDAITRMVAAELQGSWVAPLAASVIRAVGNPVDGVCTFEDTTMIAI